MAKTSDFRANPERLWFISARLRTISIYAIPFVVSLACPERSRRIEPCTDFFTHSQSFFLARPARTFQGRSYMDQTTRELTTEARRAQSKELSFITYSELRGLCASVVK